MGLLVRHEFGAQVVVRGFQHRQLVVMRGETGEDLDIIRRQICDLGRQRLHLVQQRAQGGMQQRNGAEIIWRSAIRPPAT